MSAPLLRPLVTHSSGHHMEGGTDLDWESQPPLLLALHYLISLKVKLFQSLQNLVLGLRDGLLECREVGVHPDDEGGDIHGEAGAYVNHTEGTYMRNHVDSEEVAFGLLGLAPIHLAVDADSADAEDNSPQDDMGAGK